MTNWEYLRIGTRERGGVMALVLPDGVEVRNETDALNRLGSDGWELVSVLADPQTDRRSFYFKRPAF